MGGNIKFTCETRRYDKEDYNTLEHEVINMLYASVFDEEGFGGFRKNCVQAIKAYRTKDSFGDMDLVLNSKYLEPNWTECAIEAFKLSAGDCSKNGNVFSIAYKNFQIDLIVMSDENFKSALEYYAYNDLGNLVGRLAKRIGVKYGHEGSVIVVKDNDQVLGEIKLSSNTADIYALLGLDYSTYQNGFETIEDIFKFVTTSKYFHPDIYLLENRNAISRERDRKRKTYREFLEYCEKQTFEDTYDYAEKSERGGYGVRQPFFTNLIVPAYPHVLEEYNTIIARHTKLKLFKEKFNGGIVSTVTGLQSVELGNFMKYAKSRLDEDVVIDGTVEEVVVLINQLFEDYGLTM